MVVSCAYIRNREVKIIDGKEWFHDEEELLFTEPFSSPVAVIFYDYTDDNGENGTMELHKSIWVKEREHILKEWGEFPQCMMEVRMIDDWWEDNPLADILVCNVH